MENKIQKQIILNLAEILAKFIKELMHELIANDIISIYEIAQHFKESLEKIYPDKVAIKQEEIFEKANTNCQKNLYLLDTGNLSKLQMNKNGKLFLSQEKRIFSDCINKNIYITSYEEINNCFVLSTFGNNFYFLDGYYGTQPVVKKIILTTDQYLIQNGVQAIDDEFLEWFIKNPTCKYINVELIGSYENHPELPGYPKKESPFYKIIIPKEETKQETLEEAAEKYADMEAFHIIISKIDATSNSDTSGIDESWQDAVFVAYFEKYIKDTREDELADAIIRSFDTSGQLNIDIEKHIMYKLRYNKTRPQKHGKNY